MDDKRKVNPNPKGHKKEQPQQLHTHNVPTDDMANTNGTD